LSKRCTVYSFSFDKIAPEELGHCWCDAIGCGLRVYRHFMRQHYFLSVKIFTPFDRSFKSSVFYVPGIRLKQVDTYLVNVEVLDNGIETRVEVVQQIDHLQRRALGRQTREAYDVAKVNCHLIICLGDHALPEDQLRRH